MMKSETIGKLAEALAKAQGLMKGAVKDSLNPFFKQKYADLAAVWEACKEPLSANGLAVVQTTDTSPEGAGVVIETMLLHASGEWISGRLLLTPVKNDPQGMGSAITYGRRYGLAAIVGVSPEDDDAQSASETSEKKAEKPLSPKATSAPKTNNFEFLKHMATQKNRIGDSAYYGILGGSGYEHANQITDYEAQKVIFHALCALPDKCAQETKGEK